MEELVQYNTFQTSACRNLNSNCWNNKSDLRFAFYYIKNFLIFV
jgi:hypothetical protein